jgi:ABC-2 type transport system ATP-binding protein
VIQIDQLRKTYGDLVAVNSISFTAEPGKIFGLLGPNGAGKSTTIGCISGLLKPSAGRVLIDRHDVVEEPRAARAKLGIVPQELALYQDLSASENLVYWASAYGMRGPSLKRRVTEVLELTGLLDRASEQIKNFSGGMKRRLNFAAGIVHHPEVLLLDEPTVGVDPQSRVRLLDLVRRQAAAGMTVLYTTHYMEEAENLCENLAIIDHGEIIASGTLAELREMLGASDLLRLTGRFETVKALETLNRLPGIEIVNVDEENLTLAVEQGSRRLPEIFRCLGETGSSVRDTILSQPSLESLFIRLTGKELRG